MAAKIWVGTSGWNYRHWANGVFYPPGLKQTEWLAYYSQFFATVEVNNTFYRLPEKRVFEGWSKQTPGGFSFAIKASRFFTHMRRLIDPATSVGKFFENAAGLREKMGVILFQFPPSFPFNQKRLEGFLEYLSGQQILPGVRAAIEIRDETWYNPIFFERLRQHNVALALADQPGFASDGPVTADFIFIRRHGPGGMYVSIYSEPALERDARRLKSWSGEGKDAYIYFNNDAAGYAVRNALRLKELVGDRG